MTYRLANGPRPGTFTIDHLEGGDWLPGEVVYGTRAMAERALRALHNSTSPQTP